MADPLRYLYIRDCTEFIISRIPRVVHALLKVLKGSGASTSTCTAAAISNTGKVAGPNRRGIKLAMPNVLFQAWPLNRFQLVR